MRFHVVGLPHTQTTSDYPSCAFTQKVVRFCQMMTGLRHEVFLYSGEENTAPATEHVPCISSDDRKKIVGDGHYTSAPWHGDGWREFNDRVIREISLRASARDFICLIGGTSHKPIADAFPAMVSVEFGIGYSGTFAKYRVFESYAWMHMIYGAAGGDPGSVDGGWFDAVIPNQVDPDLFPYGDGGDYFLYTGRLIDRKGYRIAQQACEQMGARLILAGPGDHHGYGEFVGEVGIDDRARLMAGACALFAPTQYIEPFGTVAIEAMASGTPVIATDWGAFTETVIHGETGFRCRTLGEFIHAAEMCGDLDRVTIRNRALSLYSMDTVAVKYEEYFNRLSLLWGDGWNSLDRGDHK